MRRILPLPLVVAAALFVAACGGKTLDTAQVEKDIKQITDATGVETTVECPDEVNDIKKGTTYECTITYAGNDSNKQTVQMKVGDNDESEFADQEAASDEVAIRGIVAQSDKDPATACEHLSEDLLAQLGGDDCATQAQEQDDGEPTAIKSLKVDGDTATMVADDQTTTFERDESGGWIATDIQ